MHIEELKSPQLDQWVARAVGERRMGHRFRPSFDWGVASALIEQEGVRIMRSPGGAPWYGKIGALTVEGPTPLMAAMRVIVARRFGMELSESAQVRLA